MGGRGAVSLSYQGANKGSGKAYGELSAFDAISTIEKNIAAHPKIADGESEALSQLRNLKSPDDIVTVYRAAPAEHINTDDWVFLSESKADRFAHSTFDKTKLKPGYNVLKIQCKASDIRFTGKNLEFAYVGKRKKGI